MNSGGSTACVAGGSRKGNDVLFHEGYKFVFQRILKCGEHRWLCSGRKKYACKSYLRTLNSRITVAQVDHPHDSEDDVTKVQLKAAVKRKATEDVSMPPRKVVRKAMLEVSCATPTAREVGNLQHVAYNAKRTRIGVLPKSRDESFDILNSMVDTNTVHGENFLLHDDKERGIMIFSCLSNLRCLEKCESIYMDGTFKYCAKYFYQLFTVHGYRNGFYIPLAFCLLPGKDQSGYEYCLRSIAEKCQSEVQGTLKPSVVVMDFEKAMHNGVLAVWPEASIVGCRFHLAQSWYRKIQELGLVRIYKDDDDPTGKWLRWVFGMPYLNPDEVSDVYCEWVLDRPHNIPKSADFAEYILRTYVSDDALFPPVLWACSSSDLARTTNACESFHAIFNADFESPHPNIYRCVAELLEIQTEVYCRLKSVEKDEHKQPRPARIEGQKWIDNYISKKENGYPPYKFMKKLSAKLLRPRDD